MGKPGSGQACQTHHRDTNPDTVVASPVSFRPRQQCTPPQHFVDLSSRTIADRLTQAHIPTYRAKQLAHHYYARFTTDPAQMSDLPLSLATTLSDQFFPPLLFPLTVLSCDQDRTEKTLWKTSDGALFESVLMSYSSRNTLCLSCQAGCGMGCAFCATGHQGLTRNLSVGEMLEQVRLGSQRLHQRHQGRLSNIVFMGMGEPLANYRRVMEAIRRIIAPLGQGFGISARAITVSTVGIVPGIYRLSEENLPLTLAISLHAPDDELRNRLVPINQRWPIDQLLDAALHFAQRTHRRVSFEYALINTINDQRWRADRLGTLLATTLGSWAHVNLIPLNPTPASPWQASPSATQHQFCRQIRQHKISCTIRHTRGREIAAACGQLAQPSS